MKVVVYLEWAEKCFRVNEGDLGFLRSLLPNGAEVVRVADDAGMERELPSATHVITWHFRRGWYALAPKLRVLATPAAGRELVELPDDGDSFQFSIFSFQSSESQPSTINHQPSTLLVHFGHYHGELMAENVAGFVLAWARGFFRLAECPAEARGWPRTWLSDKVYPVAGTTAVIAGYGNVGRAVGAKLAALGVKVVGLTHSECDALKSDRSSNLESQLSAADWFVLALPSTTGTDDFLDSALLAKLPRKCVVVNVGRGNAVDERALVGALRAGRVAGAYLDVLKYEPSGTVPDFGGAEPELLAGTVPNCIVTPHSSAFSSDYLRRSFLELSSDGMLGNE